VLQVACRCWSCTACHAHARRQQLASLIYACDCPAAAALPALSFGPKNFIIISDPGYTRQILQTNADKYSKGILR
jgi:hypothetical protein